MCVSVKVQAPRHGLSGRFLRAAVTPSSVLCFWQAEAAVGWGMAPLVSTICWYVAPRKLQRAECLWSFVFLAPHIWDPSHLGSSTSCGPPRLQLWHLLAGMVLVRHAEAHPGTNPELFILQKTFATLAEMLCESSRQERKNLHQAALNLSGTKLVT